MDYGQLPPHRPFDPRLAPLEFAAVRDPFRETRFHVGAPQWTVPDWIGKIYPPGTRSSDFLHHYSRQWKSIELNTSFYNIPSVDQVRRWASATPEEFRFFVKVFQGLSHEPDAWADLAILRSRMQAFTASWRALESRLGGFFLQLPPDFGPDRAGQLSAWLAIWPRDLSIAVEFRHPAWFRDRRLVGSAQALLRAVDAGTVITDTPGRRDASHGTLTSGKLLVRFLGQSTLRHEGPLGIDRARVVDWAKAIGTGIREGALQEVAFFIHTPDSYWVPELTADFLTEIRESGHSPSLRAPEPYVAPQLSLF